MLIAWLAIASGVTGGLLGFAALFPAGWGGFVLCALGFPMAAAFMARLRGRQWLVAVAAGAVVALLIGYAAASGYET